MDNRPIGMFDSGVGGITVLKEYLKIFPNEKFIYYADTKHIPYGNKTKEEIIEYSKKIVECLISKNVKAIIIACGTASSLAYSYLKNHYNIPIFNIIDPVAKEIKDSNIGIIATKASAISHVWENEIHKYNPSANISTVPCPLLVPLAEKNLQDSFVSKIVINKYLKKFKDKQISSLILGCTHYPLFYSQIKQLIGKDVNLINVGTYSANNFKEYLNSTSSFSNEKIENSNDRVIYITSGNYNDFIDKLKK